MIQIVVFLSTSLNCYTSTLRPVPFAPLLIQNTNTRHVASARFSTLELAFRTDSLLISGTVRLFHLSKKKKIKFFLNTLSFHKTFTPKSLSSLSLSDRPTDRLRFSSDCHCNDWSFETYFIHPQNSAQSFRLLVSSPPHPPVVVFCCCFFFPPLLLPYCSL